MTRLLIVEDDPKLGKIVKKDLEFEGYTVDLAADSESAFDRVAEHAYDLFILDVMLPGSSGYEICRRLRAQGIKSPVMMLTARSQDTDKVVGFDMGADDYLTKPFSVLELAARIKALLRRAGAGTQVTRYENGGLIVDFQRHEAARGKTRIELTSKEFQILQFFVIHKGEVLSRERFLKEVWDYAEVVNTRTVDNQISSLRRKLGWDSTHKGPKIVTIHNAGYRFTE